VKNLALVVLLTLSSAVAAQSSIPAGTILPVQLNTGVRSDKTKPGRILSTRIMQDVPLPDGAKIRSGAKVFGYVVDVRQANTNHGAQVVLRFDKVMDGKKTICVITDLRALAGMMEVSEAQVPETGPDRGTTEFDWNTVQIGGEADYHGSVITSGSNIVGRSIPPDGALVQVSSRPGTECRSNLDGNDRLQPTWVFASTACGLYGFRDLTLAHAGRTNPVGEIVLSSDKGKLNIPAGSGLLLRVN
jgi:hypothetical protein